MERLNKINSMIKNKKKYSETIELLHHIFKETIQMQTTRQLSKYTIPSIQNGKMDFTSSFSWEGFSAKSDYISFPIDIHSSPNQIWA